MNNSQAEFAVGRDDDGPAVLYALAGLKNVGEKAMRELVSARDDAGPFKSVDDFAARIDPSHMNKRQLESLIAAGALDCLHPNRAALLAVVDTILGVAAHTHGSRVSGQAGLFGDVESEGQSIRLDPALQWKFGERMNMEKEAFGFYFSAHPIDRYRDLAVGQGAREHGELMAWSDMQAGTRRPAIMAAMVESVKRRQTRKGRNFLQIELSDLTGQFSASCFEESLTEKLLGWAQDSACILMNVELDKPGDDQPPRIAIRTAQTLDEVQAQLPMRLVLDIARPEAFAQLALILGEQASGRGEVHARVMMDGNRSAMMQLASTLALGPELLEKLAPVPGISNIELSNVKPRHLQAVN